MGSEKLEKKFSFLLVLALTCLGVTAISFIMDHLGNVRYWQYDQLRTAFEMFEGIAAVLMATILLQRKEKGDLSWKFFWIISGFMSMGITDFFHAIANQGNVFVLLHSIGMVMGGFFFALIWIPSSRLKRYASKQKWILDTIIILALSFSIYTLLFHQTLPLMVNPKREFTSLAIGMNMVAGLFFLSSTVYFFLDFYRVGNLESYLFIYLTLFIGMPDLLFFHLKIWDAEWWVWHGVQLCAYLVVFGLVIHEHLTTVSDLRLALIERQKAEKDLLRRTDTLNKRVKELNCLYGISRLLEKAGISLDEILQGIVNLIPIGWQHSEITCAKITYQDQVFKTNNFRVTDRKLANDIWVKGEKVGSLEIFNLKPKDLSDERDFLPEEKVLAKNISERLGKIISEIVTENSLRGMEQEREKVQAQLFQAQKMEAIGMLASGVAHDFNNLLTTIIGYVSMAMMKIDEKSLIWPDLSQIRRASGRAANLTRQLLLFSRKQPTEPKLLNLNKTIDDLLKMLHRLIGEDIAVNVGLEPDLWSVMADEGNIEQVIMNLSVNARDAMPEGGILTLKTENKILDKEQAGSNPEARAGQFVYLSVADTGCGMDEETIKRIFEPFFTTKEVGKGTGLGLAVVYGIVKQHDGWINIESKPGQGSKFSICLPAFMEMAERESKEEIIILKEVQGRGETILVVEDEQDVLELTTAALRTNGYKVVEAKRAREALAIFELEKGKINLILTDIVLPDQSGLTIADQFLHRQPDLHILLVSGYPDKYSQYALIRERGFQFLQKPYSVEKLLQKVKEALETNFIPSVSPAR